MTAAVERALAAASEIRQVVDELRAEVVLTARDAQRADARGFLLLAADLRGRRHRLERLAQLLDDVLHAQPSRPVER